MSRLTKKEKDQRLVAKVVDDYLWAVAYRQQFSPDWERYYRMYRSRIPNTDSGATDPYPFESRVFVPYTFAIIETQLPLLIQQLFGGDRFFEVSGRKVEADLDAYIPREILNYQFEQDIKIFDLVYLWAKQALHYGTSPSFVDWRYRTRKQRIRVPDVTLNNVVLGERTIIQEKVIENGPYAAPIDLFHYFQCPATPGNPADDDDVLFAGWEFYSTIEELERDRKIGFYNDNVKDVNMDLDADTPMQGLTDRLNLLGKTGVKNRENHHRPLIPCIRYFGKVRESDRGLTYRDIVIAFPGALPTGTTGSSEGILIRDQDNPYFHDRIPVCLLRVNHNIGELYGIGDVEISESLQIELNDQRNQRNDNIVREMDKMYKVKRGLQFDESQLNYKPNGIIEVEEMDDIQPLNQGPNTLANSFVEESNIKQDIQFATGISDFIVGQFQNSSGFNDTATGISLIQGAAESRIVLKGQFLQIGVKCLGELVWQLDQQYLPFDSVFKILDPRAASRYRFVKASSAVLRAQYDFSIVAGSASGNPQIKRNQLIQVLQILPQMAAAAEQSGQKIDMDYGLLTKRVLEVFEIPNMAEIFPGLLEQQQQIAGIPEEISAQSGDGQGFDPETENQLIFENETDLQVNFIDEDLEHMISHQAAESLATPTQLSELQKHMSMHQEQFKQKQESTRQEVQGLSQALQGGNEPLTGNLENTVAPTAQSSPNDAGGQESIVRTLANSLS